MLTCGCGGDPPADRLNVLLITVDTLRADHVSGYGYPRNTTPNLDAFLETSVHFENAHSNAPWTLPSLASLMTSLHPSTHGCVKFSSRLDPSHLTLAEILQGAGYQTYGIGSHTFLKAAGGLQQGFAGFDDALIRDHKKTDRHVSSQEISNRAIRWLDELDAAGSDAPPWLLWLHYFDPHTAYVEHAGISERFGVELPVDLYDGEIAFTDHELGRVLDRLARSGHDATTLVVFASDHGEAFGEHGLDSHSTNLFGEVTRIPLAIRDPSLGAGRVSIPVESLDVLPTILDLLGLRDLPGLIGLSAGDAAASFSGRSLVPAMRGEALPARAILAETEMSRFYVADSLTLGRWKLIADRSGAIKRSADGNVSLRARNVSPGPPAHYLFDLSADPAERQDIADQHHKIVEQLRGELDEMLRTATARGRGFETSAERSLSVEEREELLSLGYIETNSPR
jgi:arylsulfatase A-like enzyme